MVLRRLRDRIIGRLASELRNFELRELRRRLRVGNDVFIQLPILISDPERVSIGERVSLAAFVHMWSEGGISIGRRTMIASHTAIVSVTHDYQARDMVSSRIERSVHIGEEVWIGAHAVLMPGVRVGDGAVIGAGAVVTCDVAAGTIVAGVPARLLKHRPSLQG